MRSLSGLASYYRRFIRGFSQIIWPLTDLTTKKVQGNWRIEEDSSFECLEAALDSAPVMRLPDFEKQFVVTTDASDVAVGAILEQNLGSGL